MFTGNGKQYPSMRFQNLIPGECNMAEWKTTNHTSFIFLIQRYEIRELIPVLEPASPSRGVWNRKLSIHAKSSPANNGELSLNSRIESSFPMSTGSA